MRDTDADTNEVEQEEQAEWLAFWTLIHTHTQ